MHMGIVLCWTAESNAVIGSPASPRLRPPSPEASEGILLRV
jgi:hypothetical protein